MAFPAVEQAPCSAVEARVPAIYMRKIVKKFHTVAGEVTVLKGIDANFYPGEFVAVVGKSGSGKSTLVNMLTGIDRPTSGEVQVGDTLIHHLNESQMSRWRGKNLGIVFQFYQLLPVLTLLENTMLPMDIAGKIPAVEREERARGLLNLVGVADVADKMPSAVSGGQQQAAAIARALANDPPLIIADEPTGNLDSRTAESIFQIFEDLARQGKTVIVVTHDPQLAQRTDRIVLLSDGEIIHPAIATAMPWLSHTQMLRLTHASQARCFRPGEVVMAAGQGYDSLYLVSAGEVTLRRHDGKEPLRLLPGALFGQVSLLSGGPAAFEVCAGAEKGAELLAVDGSSICKLVGESPAARANLLKSGEAWV